MRRFLPMLLCVVAGCAPVRGADADRVLATPYPSAFGGPPSPGATPLAPDGFPPPPPDAVPAKVVRVVDGDTLVLEGIDSGNSDASTGGRTSRLIGVDTPEVSGGVECFGREASDFTRRELMGRDVLVGFDVGRLDRFGRALTYVWKDGVLFNARLVADGYAQQLTVPPNVRYAELFSRLVTEAREADRGLWAGCPVPTPSASPGPTVAARAAPAPIAPRVTRASTPRPPTPRPSEGPCHPSYPTVCIPPAPPDLDCPDIQHRDFTVRHDVAEADPHNFDRDLDSVGCESDLD